jgi:hypothetical protein
MPNILSIENQIVAYFTQSGVGDFTINGNANLLLFGLNNARRFAERAHDFFYSQIDCFLSIGSLGSALTSAYIDTTVTAAGTLSPNVAGAFALTGTYNSLPFYTKTVSSVVYFLSYSGIAWTITAGGFTAGSDYWSLTTASASPVGVYTAHGANTGALTITQTTGTISIKRVSNVFLPIAGGFYVPIEFLTNDEWNERVAVQYGRQHYNSAKTGEEIGLSQFNAVAVQQGQTISLEPEPQFTFPIVSKLSAIRWLADYTADTDTDFMTQFAPDFLMWRAIVEINNYFKVFVKRTEGNVDEAFVQTMADTALQALIVWDTDIATGTTTPTAVYQPSTQSQSAASQSRAS